ncbi:hypothetical protein BST15_19895 [Mycolicibacter arupensis]|uniref:Tc1-like transposase DDE domain-containing protein n=1 Tax=Mycolicibacter arupensis TaxID=342002 RepID=A0ABX3RBP4_9MYCO|nr:hypothetical protein BST15_19895 [Mycolicibacter arupensis]
MFWVVDNGSSHRGQASINRLRDRWPNLRLINLPVHASWLNQVEIYFSVVQRKVFSSKDFHTLDDAEARLLDFQHCYEQIATLFEWKFTKDDLHALLERIAAHEDAALTPGRITGATNTPCRARFAQPGHRAAMGLSSVSVVTNSLRLRRFGHDARQAPATAPIPRRLMGKLPPHDAFHA